MSNGKPHARPAQLGFLAIYNPSLGATDETLDQQIVYYFDHDAAKKTRRGRDRREGKVPKDEMNKRLRQIGLAQGMVDFGRSFSSGDAVDAVETEKSRIILHELELGWWVLASVDLSQLPLASPPKSLSAKDAHVEPRQIEYSSREVKPAALLLRDLLRAHTTFLLHHASSMSELFVRTKRPKFMSIVSRYWDSFLATWNVLLHGNPAVDIYGGIKLAASGELGVGVGEEDRGSGEREVLEGFVGRIEGLVDIIVSKFGDADEPMATQPWLGLGAGPTAEDGAIFLGTGALSRKSLRAVTRWMEDVYTWGNYAYGINQNPTATRKARPRQISTRTEAELPRQAEAPVTPKTQNRSPSPKRLTDPSKLTTFLKLGYGTHWTISGIKGAEAEAALKPSPPSERSQHHEAAPPEEPVQSKEPAPSKEPAAALDGAGHFLIGMIGDMEEKQNMSGEESAEEDGDNLRIPIRTLTVELERAGDARAEEDISIDLGTPDQNRFASTRSDGAPRGSFDSQDRNKTKRLRVVVYVNRPFMFTFLFELGTDALAWEGLYRSLHYQLSPLQRPLVASTKYRLTQPVVDANGLERTKTPIYDLIWDPRALTIYATIPNIPDPFVEHPPWTRLEALSTHTQLLTTYATTRTHQCELERTCKTSRGWWIVWTRVPDDERPRLSPAASRPVTPITTPSQGKAHPFLDRAARPREPSLDKEVVLIRRSSEFLAATMAKLGGGLLESSWGADAARLAQGIGVDTKRYIDGLLNLYP